ncbi:hypothetical protein C8R45DRAFT_1008345 [Mycena sanguinolenta]|nr:hypothetical protein C8R45DRAFT_1008345 [Mycena sanguinolenta]
MRQGGVGRLRRCVVVSQRTCVPQPHPANMREVRVACSDYTARGRAARRAPPPAIAQGKRKTTPPNPENEKQERNGKTGTRRKNKSPSPAPDATPHMACAFLLLCLVRLVSSTAPPACTPSTRIDTRSSDHASRLETRHRTTSLRPVLRTA